MTAPSTTPSATLEQLSEEAIASRSEAAGEPTWLRDQRLEAYKRWVDQEWPKVRGEELWKDTPFTRFSVDVPAVTDGSDAAIASPLLDDHGELAAHVRLQDGRVEVSVRDDRVVVADLATAAAEHETLVREHLGAQIGDGDRTVTTNAAAWTHGVFIHVPDEVELDGPIGVTVAAGEPGGHLPRVLVVVGNHARAKVYLEHVSSPVDEPVTVDEVVEAVLLDGSRLDLVSLQHWGDRVGHLSLQAAEVHRDAFLRHLAVTIGGETVRVRPEVHLVGPGARVEPLGVYFSDAGQHFEHHPFIEHVAGHTTSDVLYKGALQGKSRTVFRGHIFIHKDAVGSDSNEVNKSLILTPGARADSTPFLEIECAEVVAGHGSATGQVDAEQLFYLQSRGVSADQALRLVVFGFFAEVLERIDLPAVRDRALQHIEDEIARADLSALIERGSAA